jgi:hypothetical protein
MSRLLVCNPITKSWGILPHLEEALSLDNAKAKVLAFDETSKSFKLFLADVQHGDNDSGVPQPWSRGIPSLMTMRMEFW